MKKIIIIFFLLICLTGCNKRNDIDHLSAENMTKYVHKIIDEDVEFISQNIAGDTATYTYKLTDRDIEFHMSSSISAIFIDGSQFSNYKEKISTDYEYAIAYSDYYKEERNKLAIEYNINESLINDISRSYYKININNYNDLENLVNYYIAVDNLYNFKEKKPSKIANIIPNKIYTSTGINFSMQCYTHTKKDELKFKKTYSTITSIYKDHLKEEGKTDPALKK